MNFSFIFIGSTHGFIDDFQKQKEIIELTKPEFVLCEELEDFKLDSKDKFDELLKKSKISNMTSFNEVEEIIRLCYKNHIKLIGIDFHNFGFNEGLQKKIKSQEELTKEEEEELNKITKLREEYHLSKILEYKKKTSRPIVILVGCWHLREKSLLREKVNNYKVILPCNKEGKPLFSPDEDKNLSYMEIVSNESQNKKN